VTNDELKERLKEEEIRVEKIKADLYSSLGRVALLNELLTKGIETDAV
jgi:hypothetical protein